MSGPEDLNRAEGQSALLRRKGSFLGTVKAVAASFFGVRGGKAHREDMANLNPLHVIIIGVAMAALFVLTLVMIVKLVVR